MLDVFRSNSLDLRIECADAELARQKTGIPAVWYNNATSVSGMRFRGFPIGHHMGTDTIDLFVRTTRHLGDGLQLGANFNWQERDGGQSPHETKRDAAVVTSSNHFLWTNLSVQF